MATALACYFGQQMKRSREMEKYQTLLLWASALGALLIAGVFFAFSSFVISGLGRLPANQGIAAMNSVNVTVINPVFMAAFLGTGIIALALIVTNFSSMPDPAAIKIIAGALIYLIGSIGVTMIFNVPLNDALAASNLDGAALWADYLKTWTMWNHVRCLASLAAGALMFSALGA
jgi:uncharacterized membrane protein